VTHSYLGQQLVCEFQHCSIYVSDWLRAWVDKLNEQFVELEEILQKHIKYYLESMTLKFYQSWI